MKNTKKVLGVLLAVVMAFSALSMAVFAAITVTVNSTEDPNAINVKLEVVQVPSATDNDSGETYDAVDNDIYAVTIYAKTPATFGLYTFRTCLKYDADKFQPMMSYDGADLLVGEDYYDETGEKTSLFVEYGAQFSDDHFYDAAGNVVSKASQATTVGLGKSASGTMVKSCNITVDGEDVYYSDDYGVMFCETLFQPKNKGAYQNAINGVLSADYVEIMTVYFQRQVAEDAVYGSEFGIVAGDIANGENDDVIAAANGAAGYSNNPAHALSSAPMNFVANAVEAAIKPLVGRTSTTGAKAQAIAFNLDPAATPTYVKADITSVDYRFVAQFSTSAFPIDYDPATEAVNSTDIDEVGFIMANTNDIDTDAAYATLTNYTAAQVANNLSKDTTDANGCRKCWTNRISTDMAGDSAFAFSCRIKGIAVTGGNVAAEYVVVPYIIANGEVTFGATAQFSTVQAKYEANFQTFLDKKNA